LEVSGDDPRICCFRTANLYLQLDCLDIIADLRQLLLYVGQYLVYIPCSVFSLGIWIK
jgi:hypothetical protein